MFTFNYVMFGVPILDTIFTIVIKFAAAWLMILIVKNGITYYQRADYPQLVVSVLIGVIILGVIIGLNNVYTWGGALMGMFTKGSGGTGGGGIG
ncbi:hypothetical protein RB620_24795 [Paenibacillus sp. LHD-117]|uniref:hypothetical protein n=1 Tax=Paenibacillus sp. LHD-117 TaxID=3071412 RepID=UPI0027E063B1|nr:hypothetical protein [Paenibacillus sp. LHD-117]MDQ6422656.1 hypothetical protein [Paenibacillus sp. LHD-117]